MDEQQINDDSSHYEISLTATQAFVAFVLLLLSLAASFAFGVMVGRGRLDAEVARRLAENEATQITEKPMPALPAPATDTTTGAEGGATPIVEPYVIVPVATDSTATTAPPAEPPEITKTETTTSAAELPVFAQLLSTSDAKTAETLAAKLIDAGYMTAYVERSKGDLGTTHRVRVRFKTEAEARGAVPKLQTFTTETIWVTKQ